MITKINENFAKRVACAYDAMKHEPEKHEVRQAYLHLAIETIRQYRTVLKAGLKVEYGNYEKPSLAVKDIQENNHLFVFPTLDGYGSNKEFKPSGNPLLNYSGFYISGKPALINDLFRVVHDYFGHAKPNNGFRAVGEENAYRCHAVMFSPMAKKALASETRGQNSWVNFGPHAKHNKTAKQDTIFADQKMGILPQWAIEFY